MSEYDPLSPVTVPTRRILGTHPNIPELLDGIEQDPTELNSLFAGFDIAVEDYDALSADQLPKGLIHLPKVKPVLETVPTINDMLSNPRSDVCRAFIRSLHDMSPLMQRAEAHEPEPYIGFHVWEGASTAERLVGGIFQAYGMTIASSTLGRDAPKEEQYSLRDTLLDGLIEAAVLNKANHEDNRMLDAVKSLGWFEAKNADGSYLFSDQIRALAQQ